MFPLLMVFACVAIMVKVADMEGRSTLLWGGYTFVACFACGYLIPLPLLNIVLGLVFSFLSMFVVNMLSG